MTQTQDMAFHPSSPPSEGGADSYRLEDTPDTRLTTFSPLEDSSKSSRLLNALTLSNEKTDAQPVKFEFPSNTIHRMASVDSITSVIHDKDPFITSTPEKTETQTQTKLSATASAFRPLSATPVVANGSSNDLATPKPLSRSVINFAQSPNTGLRVYTDIPLSSAFSHELKLSRSVRVTSTSGNATRDAVDHYLSASD